MKRRMGILWMFLILCLTACGVDSAPETTAPEETVVVEIPYETEADNRAYVGTEIVFAVPLKEDSQEAQVLRDAADVFEKHTGAVVELVLTDNWKTSAQLMEEGKADIVRFPVEKLGGYKELLLDLTEMAKQADYDTRSYPVLRQQILDNCGTLSALACAPEVVGIYYNAGVLEAAGVTAGPENWEDFLTVCKKLNKTGWLPLSLNEEDVSLALKLHLGDDSKMEAAQIVELADQILDFVDSGYMMQTAAPGGHNKLAISNAAMTVGSNTLCNKVEEETYTRLRWGVFPWPGNGSFVSCDALAVSSGCANPQAAFDFAMLLITGEFDQLLTDVAGGISADPNNTPAIDGAEDVLRSAESEVYEPYSEARQKLAAKLWAGKYKGGKGFTSVWTVTE